jgi:hypothetical protein
MQVLPGRVQVSASTTRIDDAGHHDQDVGMCVTLIARHLALTSAHRRARRSAPRASKRINSAWLDTIQLTGLGHHPRSVRTFPAIEDIYEALVAIDDAALRPQVRV